MITLVVTVTAFVVGCVAVMMLVTSVGPGTVMLTGVGLVLMGYGMYQQDIVTSVYGALIVVGFMAFGIKVNRYS